ncbi:MAG: hypothetical protein Q4F57_05750 [Weeksellaceae bacterium]|nr:hypothetical protein [Weeksellaceae bacterium]
METRYFLTILLTCSLILGACTTQPKTANQQQDQNASRIDSLLKGLPEPSHNQHNQTSIPLTDKNRVVERVPNYSNKRFENDQPRMQKLREEIDFQIQRYRCTDPEDWRVSSMGAKACGGPAFYIAYPIVAEYRIIDKIAEYTRLQEKYNRENNIQSDCAMVMPPSELRCENEQIVLIYNNRID